MMFERVAGPVGAEDAPGVFCCGLRVICVDGTTLEAKNSKVNREHFAGPSNEQGPGHYPHVRLVVAGESGTGSLVGGSFGAYTTGEQTLARDLLAAFGPKMLVVADRNFLSHALARDVLGTGAHILWRASASFALAPTRVLADGSYLARLNPATSAEQPIVVRVIEYTVHTTGPDGTPAASELFALVTDLLDVEAYPGWDLAEAYHLRWGIETLIAHHKTDMGKGQAVLRSETVEGVAQEIWALFAVYQAIHQLIGAGITTTGIPPGLISFPNALEAAADSITAAFPPRRP
jgi:hypothetical protein